MSEQIKLIMPWDPPEFEKSINMETAKSNKIPNSQVLEISDFEKSQFSQYSQYEIYAKLRSDPTPRYNCHGMTFAARRTCVYDNATILQIISDDGYVEVPKDYILPGDIIIYYSTKGDAEHSGMVLETFKEDDHLKVPLIVSKWGKYSEFIHRANNCPYEFSRTKFFRVSIKK